MIGKHAGIDIGPVGQRRVTDRRLGRGEQLAHDYDLGFAAARKCAADFEWDAVVPCGVDLVWLMGLWARSEAGRRIAGLTIRAKVNHLDPNAQKEASLNAQLNMAGYDTLGACIFAGFGYAATPDFVVKRLLQARYGWDDLPDNVLQALGKETIKMEREFNRRAGFTKEDDRLPKWMTEQPIPENGAVFDVSEETLDHIFDGIE